LVLLYIAFILLGHDAFVQLSVVVMNKLSLPVYNQRVLQLIWASGFFFVIYTFYNLCKTPTLWQTKLFFLTLCLVGLGAHIAILFEMNIEIIHVLEYVILVGLIFPFSRSISVSLVLALPVMIADELHQYLVLYPNYNKYFEWNDIVLDLLGAGTLFLMWHIGGLTIQKPKINFVFWALLGFVGLMLLGFGTKLFVYTPTDATSFSWIVFNRLDNPNLFWQIHAFTGARYHVLSPTFGVLLILSVLFVFAWYEKLVFSSKSKKATLEE